MSWFADLSSDERNALMKDTVEHAPTSILRCISEGSEIEILATEGKRTIQDAKETFSGWVDPDFKNWGVSKVGVATLATPVKVHEMVQNATFPQMFDSLGAERKNLCLTDDQIIMFCEKHQQWLHTEGNGTFFLLEFEGKFFVAFVYFVGPVRLDVGVYRFENAVVWHAGGRHRVVVPQL